MNTIRLKLYIGHNYDPKASVLSDLFNTFKSPITIDINPDIIGYIYTHHVDNGKVAIFDRNGKYIGHTDLVVEGVYSIRLP